MISRVNKSLQSPSAGSYFLFVFESSADKKVVSVYTEGKFQAKQYTEAERLCRDACESVFQFYRDTTQRFASWFCKYFWKFVGNSLKWFCTKNGQRQHAMISLLLLQFCGHEIRKWNPAQRQTAKKKRTARGWTLHERAGAPLHNNLIVTKLLSFHRSRLSCNEFTSPCISLCALHFALDIRSRA